MFSASVRNKILLSIDIRPALAIVWQSSRRWVLASSLVTLLQGLLPLASLYLLKLIVDAVEAGVRSAPEGMAGDGAFTDVLWLVAAAAGVALFGALLQTAAIHVSEVQGHLVADHMLTRLHRQSVRVDQAFYEDPSYHDTLYLAQQQAPHRPKMILESLTLIFQNGISLLAMGGLLFLFHWALPLVLFIAALPGLFVRLRHADIIYRWHVGQAPDERRARYFGHVLTHSDYAKELRLFGLGGLFNQRFEDVRSELRSQLFGLSRRRSLAELIAQASGILAIFGSLAFIAWRTLSGTISLGDLVMYYQAFQRGQGFLRGMLLHLANLYGNNLYLSSFREFLALEPTITRPASPRPVPAPIRRGLRFEAVSFAYPGSERPALEGVDLHIAPGETVALVGANGAGKTTLIKLLCRLYDPTSGRITVDGIDLRELDPEAWRRQIGVVLQDYSCYQLSARENIWLGDIERPAHDAAIEAAARDAGVDAALRGLPAGYDNPLGKWFENGQELSVGQWQKIALARAFLRRGQVTILDEPTSALDVPTEKEFLENLQVLARDRTAVLVSHRLSTVKMADRIVVLDGGRVTQHGHHDELVADADGLYAWLFSSQARPYRR